jgi:tetratricopeptide (TPR) repeat protein
MNAKAICVLFAACILLIIFSIGGVITFRLMEQRNTKAIQSNEKVMLVVAKRDYPKGTIITDPEQMFELREFLLADRPSVAFEKLEQVGWDGVLINDIREGQPLTRDSLGSRIIKALLDLRRDNPPGPGRYYMGIPNAKARKGSIRVGTRVDVIEEDPKGESKILLHDALVRVVLPGTKDHQEILDNEGKTDWVALQVIVDTSLEEAKASLGIRSIFLELRPIGENKKADEKNSAKVEGGTWAGKRVIRKTPYDIKIVHRDEEDRKVDVGTLQRIKYTVLKEQGQWIMVREKGVQGWAPKEKFVLLEDAPAYFTQRIRGNPKDAFAWFFRACAWDARGELDNAIDDFTEAIRLNPDTPSYAGPVYINRAIAHTKKKDYDRA